MNHWESRKRQLRHTEGISYSAAVQLHCVFIASSFSCCYYYYYSFNEMVNATFFRSLELNNTQKELVLKGLYPKGTFFQGCH